MEVLCPAWLPNKEFLPGSHLSGESSWLNCATRSMKSATFLEPDPSILDGPATISAVFSKGSREADVLMTPGLEMGVGLVEPSETDVLEKLDTPTATILTTI